MLVNRKVSLKTVDIALEHTKIMSTTIQTSHKKLFQVAGFVLASTLGVFGTTSIAAADPLHVSEQEAQKAIVQKVRPSFPAIAKQLKLSGRVVVDLLVSETGSVEKADVVSGNPVLGTAATTAGKGWKFQPFMADGKPSKAVVRVNFDFTE